MTTGAGEMRFDGEVAVVTGAGRGLGRLYALALAARGPRVVVNDLGAAMDGSAADVSVAAIVATALREFGRLDVLVNNAGNLRRGLFEEMSDEMVGPVLGVHLLGAVHVTRPAWRHMREHGGGRILMTTSRPGIIGTLKSSNYGAAKMGLIGLMRVLAVEGAAHGIRVNAIAPMARSRLQGLVDQATKSSIAPDWDALQEHLPMEAVVPAVLWLLHRDSGVTGEIITTGGGRVARYFVGVTHGYFNPPLTPEDVRDHAADVLDESGYVVPRSAGDEFDEFRRRAGLVAAQPPGSPSA